MNNRQAEKLDPSVYTTMQEVPVEYQKEKQAEYRVMELQPDENDNDDLAVEFNALNIANSENIDCANATIAKGYSTKKAHIGDLPTEMLYQIARRVIGPNLSYKSLSWLSMTCKAWHGIVRDDDLWRRGCEELWDDRLLSGLLEQHHHCFKQVFIHTPRPNISEGLYVAHQSYWREGAAYATRGGWGFAQQHVNYRRYTRFLPDKRIFTYTSADEPRQVLRKVMSHDFLKLGGMIGSWSFTDDNMRICAILGKSGESYENVIWLSEPHPAKDETKLEKFIVMWQMEKRGKRLRRLEYAYEGYNIDRDLVHSTAYDVREYTPLQLHKIPKNFQL